MENQTNHTIVPWVLIKLGSVWGLIAVTNWEHAAGFVAFCYTCILMLEYTYKKAKVYREWKQRVKGGSESDGGSDNTNRGI